MATLRTTRTRRAGARVQKGATPRRGVGQAAGGGTVASRWALLMSHEDRQALIRRPFPITYIPPVKRWGGVQLINDEDWMRDANAWRKKYNQDADDLSTEDSL
jgi:hypothetical protein